MKPNIFFSLVTFLCIFFVHFFCRFIIFFCRFVKNVYVVRKLAFSVMKPTDIFLGFVYDFD